MAAAHLFLKQQGPTNPRALFFFLPAATGRPCQPPPPVSLVGVPMQEHASIEEAAPLPSCMKPQIKDPEMDRPRTPAHQIVNAQSDTFDFHDGETLRALNCLSTNTQDRASFKTALCTFSRHPHLARKSWHIVDKGVVALLLGSSYSSFLRDFYNWRRTSLHGKSALVLHHCTSLGAFSRPWFERLVFSVGAQN